VDELNVTGSSDPLGQPSQQDDPLLLLKLRARAQRRLLEIQNEGQREVVGMDDLPQAKVPQQNQGGAVPARTFLQSVGDRLSGQNAAAVAKEAYEDKTVADQTVMKIGSEGASALARLDFNLASGNLLESAEREAELAKRAIELDLRRQGSVENVQIDRAPKSNRIIYKVGDGQWNYVSPPGWSNIVKDAVAALPEVGVGAASVISGIGGAAVGTAAGGGPFTAIPGSIAATGLGEAWAHLQRLKFAKERGMLDDVDESQMMIEAAIRGAAAAGLQGGAEMLMPALRRLVTGTWGGKWRAASKVAEVGPSKEAYREGLDATARLAEETEAFIPPKIDPVTGKEVTTRPKFTTGQTAGAPTALAQSDALGREQTGPASTLLQGERAARQYGPEGDALRGIDESQKAAIQAIDTELFPQAAGANARAQAGEVMSEVATSLQARIAAKGKQFVESATGMLDKAGQKLGQLGGRSVDKEVDLIRTKFDQAYERVHTPYTVQFNKLGEETGIVIPLSGFRAAVHEIEKKWGDNVLGQGIANLNKKLLDKAKTAGLEETQKLEIGEDLMFKWVKHMKENAPTLGDIQNTLAIARRRIRELRTAATAKEKSKLAALQEFETALTTARDEALNKVPGALKQVKALEAGYADTMKQFSRGIVGDVMREVDGRYVLTSGQALDNVLENPAAAREFGLALRNQIAPDGKDLGPLPESGDIMSAMQRALFNKLHGMFVDDTGKVNVKGLTAWRDQHRDALEYLFNDPAMPGSTGQKLLAKGEGSIGALARQVEKVQARAEAWGKLAQEKLGVYTSEPATLVSTLMKEQNVTKLRDAHRLVRLRGTQEEQAEFLSGIRSAVRKEISGGNTGVSADRIDAFMNSEHGEWAMGALGERFRKGMGLMRDLARVRDMKPGPNASTALSEEFTKSLPALRSLSGAVRNWLVGPISKWGRRIQSARWYVKEARLDDLVSVMTDPESLLQVQHAFRMKPGTTRFINQMGRLGLEGWNGFWSDAAEQGATPDSVNFEDMMQE
jgi:hypothetical protein